MTRQEMFAKAEEYRNLIIKMKPFDTNQLKEIDEYFRVILMENSNTFEGDTFNLSETNFTNAYVYMLQQARMDNLIISENIIKKLHYLLFNNENFNTSDDSKEVGNYRRSIINRSFTGHRPPAPEELSTLMRHFINQMDVSKKMLHPIEFAAMCFKRIVDIQPFEKGNVLIAILVMNLISVNMGYGIVVISQNLKEKLIKALAISQQDKFPDIDMLVNLIAECVVNSEKEMYAIAGSQQ